MLPASAQNQVGYDVGDQRAQAWIPQRLRGQDNSQCGQRQELAVGGLRSGIWISAEGWVREEGVVDCARR